jgi:hypothetical protein
MIEVHPDAAPLIDVRATERLMELEAADVDVPPPPKLDFRPPLYFRILALSPWTLRVELWELGQPRGARSVSTAGSDILKSRRIALAAAELARRLRQQRLSEIRAAAEAPKEVEDEKKHGGIPIYGRLTWSAGAQAAAVGLGSAWVAGPVLEAGLRFASGPRLALGAAWLAGEASTFAPSASARWAEVNVGVGDAFAVAPSLGVSVGLVASVAALRVGSPAGPATPALDGWSSRAGVNARLELALGRSLTISLGPDLGVVLRPVSALGADGDRHRVSGLWLGGGLALTVDQEAF